MDPDKPIPLNELTPEQLAQLKIEARLRLLAMDPETAQHLADQTLQPQNWTHALDNEIWDESIPTTYGETDS